MKSSPGFVFELERLPSYDDEALLAEVVRVAALVPSGPLTARQFDALAKVSHHAVQRRFGGWRQALVAAGLGDRYTGKPVTAKMRTQAGKRATRDEMLAELQRVAQMLGARSLSIDDLSSHSATIGPRSVISRFGSWRVALEAAGLELSVHGRRYSETDYFENLLAVWTHYGRVPRYAEMDHPPSVITAGGYAQRFGTWTKARLAFLAAVNATAEPEAVESEGVSGRSATAEGREPSPRSLSVGLRYRVLVRDRFRCVLCGRSPATELECVLHVDHILAVARGGLGVPENLRTLCQDCNLGKGSRLEQD